MRLIITTPVTKLGFSFIELLVTVSIMLVVLGGGIAGYIQFNQRQTVLEASKRLQTMLRTARTKAQVRDTPAAGDCVLQGYQFAASSTSPGATVRLNAWCGATQATATAYSTPVETFTLPTGVALSSGHSIIYYTLHGGTNVLSAREVVVSDGSTTYRFTVSPGGDISEGCFGADKCN